MYPPIDRYKIEEIVCDRNARYNCRSTAVRDSPDDQDSSDSMGGISDVGNPLILSNAEHRRFDTHTVLDVHGYSSRLDLSREYSIQIEMIQPEV